MVSASEHLHIILDGVCELLTVYELVAKVNLNSDLTALLGQNIQDSCNWVSITSSHSTVVLCIQGLLWFVNIKTILKENSELTFSYKLFPY